MDLAKLFDEYELKARLQPSLIIIFPLVLGFFVWYPEIRELGSAAVSLITTFGILALLSRISRNAGKHKEKGLYEKWGGIPTSYFLRHNDQNLDVMTKKRYHNYLQSSISGLILPNEAEELSDIQSANNAYESAIRWLREKTRDKQKFSLVFKDNVHYGFSRNLWAMKPWGITLSTAVLLSDIVVFYMRNGFYSFNDISPEIWIFAVIDLIYLYIWLFLINSKWVRNSAEAYARSLLAACEQVCIENTLNTLKTL